MFGTRAHCPLLLRLLFASPPSRPLFLFRLNPLSALSTSLGLQCHRYVESPPQPPPHPRSPSVSRLTPRARLLLARLLLLLAESTPTSSPLFSAGPVPARSSAASLLPPLRDAQRCSVRTRARPLRRAAVLKAQPSRLRRFLRRALRPDIVKDVRGSESNCEHDSRKI